MEDRNDIVTRMNQNFAQMSKSHKKIASYIMDHYDTAVFMTAATLGKEIGIWAARRAFSRKNSRKRWKNG